MREWVLHYVEDEAAGRVMPEADAITRLNDLGFADVRIAYRRYMDAVLIAHKTPPRILPKSPRRDRAGHPA